MRFTRNSWVISLLASVLWGACSLDDTTEGNGKELVSLEKTELTVPIEGGTYTMPIHKELPVELSLKEPPTRPDGSVPAIDSREYYYSDPIQYTPVLDKQALHLTVQPTSARVMTPATIRLYDMQGNCRATLLLRQTGKANGPILKENGVKSVSSVMANVVKAMVSINNLDAEYTLQDRTHPFDPLSEISDGQLLDCWKKFFKTINTINFIRKFDEDYHYNILLAPLYTLGSLCYSQAIAFWGDMPYLSVHPSEVGSNEIELTPVDSIFKSLTSRLEIAIETLDEKGGGYTEDKEEFIFFSKDIPRLVLAQIYMYQNNYKEAWTLLRKIESGKHYQLENTLEYTEENKEIMLGIKSNVIVQGKYDIVPVLTYSDVILSLAECAYHLNEMDAAEGYLKQIAEKKNLSYSSSDLLIAIKEVRNQALCKQGGYFAFLKRNGLAQSELGLKDSQLLLPYPPGFSFVQSVE